jgi:hypothetical protein
MDLWLVRLSCLMYICVGIRVWYSLYLLSCQPNGIMNPYLATLQPIEIFSDRSLPSRSAVRSSP